MRYTRQEAVRWTPSFRAHECGICTGLLPDRVLCCGHGSWCVWSDSAVSAASCWLRQFADLGARQVGAVRNRGVVRDPSIGAFAGVDFGLPDAADDIGRPVSAEQFHYAGPVGQAVRADDAAGAIAEQRDTVQVMKGPAAGYRFLRRVRIILGDPVTVRLVPASPQRLDAGVSD